jgi:phage-related protein
MRPTLLDITWLGDSLTVIRQFTKPVRQRIGGELYRLQIGMDPIHWKPMPQVGPAVREIRISSRGQYRVIYVSRSSGPVVLHAFAKKSRRTSRADLAIARERHALWKTDL